MGLVREVRRCSVHIQVGPLVEDEAEDMEQAARNEQQEQRDDVLPS